MVAACSRAVAGAMSSVCYWRSSQTLRGYAFCHWLFQLSSEHCFRVAVAPTPLLVPLVILPTAFHQGLAAWGPRWLPPSRDNHSQLRSATARDAAPIAFVPARCLQMLECSHPGHCILSLGPVSRSRGLVELQADDLSNLRLVVLFLVGYKPVGASPERRKAALAL